MCGHLTDYLQVKALKVFFSLFRNLIAPRPKYGTLSDSLVVASRISGLALGQNPVVCALSPPHLFGEESKSGTRNFKLTNQAATIQQYTGYYTTVRINKDEQQQI